MKPDSINSVVRLISGKPIRAVGSSDLIYLNKEIPNASDLKLPAQSKGFSIST